MSYTIRKKQAGQEVVKKLTFYLNRCKYTSGDFVIQNLLFTDIAGSIADDEIDVNLTLDDSLSPDWLTTWGDYPTYPFLFFVIAGEILKVEVVDSTNVTIKERGLFGTIAQEITDTNTVSIEHEGRLDKSCFGYSQTCSTADSYETGLFKELVFSSAPLPAGSVYHGGLLFKDVSYTSAELKPGEAISSRSRVSFKLLDQTHNDYDLVYWPEQRNSEGTLFGKLLARHPYFNNRNVMYSVGLRDSVTLSEPEWENRTFIIDAVNLSSETFSGSALDPLILTEGKKAKMPLASPAQLTTIIDSGSTNIVFGNAPLDYFGSSANVIVRIDSELLEVTANGTATMAIVTRGFGNTEIKDHSINATVQNCLRFIYEHVVDCITYALSTWTSIPATFIDDYTDVKDLMPTIIISDYTLSAPKDVVEFINMCIFVGNLSFYFDDVTQKIVIKYISEFEISPIYLSDIDNIKKESIRRDFNLKEQFTRFNLSWAPFDLTKDSDQKNFQISLTSINSEMESLNKFGEVNERKPALLPMLNASTDDYLIGAEIVNRVVSAANEMPDFLECELDAESIGETQNSVLELGSVVSVNAKAIQDKNGNAQPRLYQVLKISGDAFESFKVKMKHFQLMEPSNYDFLIEAGTYINYVLTDEFNPLTPGQYVIYIKSGAIFGSYDTAIAAFDTGTPNSGVTFKIIARWQVLGMGGKGGDAQAPTGGGSQFGEQGGIAFEAGCNVIIDNGAGLMWAGGGGAHGQYIIPISPQPPRFGGGGGQGFGYAEGGLNTDGVDYTNRAPTGTQTKPGGGGANLKGGEWGEKGEQLVDFPRPTNAGVAIKSNGFNVTIIAGNNNLSIRGLRT